MLAGGLFCVAYSYNFKVTHIKITGMLIFFQRLVRVKVIRVEEDDVKILVTDMFVDVLMELLEASVTKVSVTALLMVNNMPH